MHGLCQLWSTPRKGPTISDLIGRETPPTRWQPSGTSLNLQSWIYHSTTWQRWELGSDDSLPAPLLIYRAGFIIQRTDRGESRDVEGRSGDSTHKMTAFRHFSESTGLDLSFNNLTEVRAGMWEVSDDSLPALLWIYRAGFIIQRADRGESGDVGGKWQSSN